MESRRLSSSCTSTSDMLYHRSVPQPDLSARYTLRAGLDLNRDSRFNTDFSFK